TSGDNFSTTALATCGFSQTCTTPAFPCNGHNIYQARVGSSDGTTTVLATANLTLECWSVSLAAGPPNPPSSGSSTLTATTNADVGPTPWWIQIFDIAAPTVALTNCGGGTTCSTNVTCIGVHTYQTRVSSSDGTNVQALSNTVTLTCATPTPTQ